MDHVEATAALKEAEQDFHEAKQSYQKWKKWYEEHEDAIKRGDPLCICVNEERGPPYRYERRTEVNCPFRNSVFAFQGKGYVWALAAWKVALICLE